MDKYMMLGHLGEGTFGCVRRAMNKRTGEIVAIKIIKQKYSTLEECMELPEVKALRRLYHPNIVKLKEVLWENDVLYLAFEYMECNLHELIQGRRMHFSESEVRDWCYQMFKGLSYMHHHGYFHRDLKPANMLVSKGVLKIADLGSALKIDSEPPYTSYITTRWYRAPEVMLESRTYNPAIDMWAMGAIMAELFISRPLFPGSNVPNQMLQICSVIGSPNSESWPEGIMLARKLNYQFPQCAGVDISELIPTASKEAIDLIKLLCSWDPSKRPSAFEALQHPFFKSCGYVPRSISQLMPPPGFHGKIRHTEQKCPLPQWMRPERASNFSCMNLLSAAPQKLDLNLNAEDAINNDIFSSSELLKNPHPVGDLNLPPPLDLQTLLYMNNSELDLNHPPQYPPSFISGPYKFISCDN